MTVYPVSAQYAKLSGMARFDFGKYNAPKKEKRTTKSCKRCAAELPLEAYRFINDGPIPKKRRRSPTCPACEFVAQAEFEKHLNTLIEALGNDQLSAAQLASKLNCTDDLVRYRCNLLVERKVIKRTAGGKPYLFFKA
jgi:hypothetical protein